MTAANGWNAVELRDNRYNHIVHMVSAANGAEDFYSTEVSEKQKKKFETACPIQFKYAKHTHTFSHTPKECLLFLHHRSDVLQTD